MSTDTPSAPDGYCWAWVPCREIPHDNRWQVVAALEAKRCRWSDAGVRCNASSSARLNRARYGGPPQWWHYCADHLFGRRIVDGEVQARILAPTGPILERGLE